MKNKGSFTLFRFAKKVQGLSNQEKAALIAIADAQGEVNGECYTSIPNMAEDYGRTVRSLQRGIHGYKRHDKKAGTSRVVAEGLVNRGLIYALGSTAGGSHSNTTRWRINAGKLASYLPKAQADKFNHLLYQSDSTGDTTGDQTGDIVSLARVTPKSMTGDKRASDGCHSAGQPPNTSSPDHASPEKPTSPISTKTAAGRLSEIFGQQTGKPLPGGTSKRNQELVAEAMEIAPNQVVNLWKHWISTKNLTGLNWPLGVFVSELPGLTAAYASSEREYMKEEIEAFKARLDRQNKIEHDAIMNRELETEPVPTPEDLFGPDPT
jgi:hypothetical protein